MTRSVLRAARSLHVLVAVVVLAGPVCARLCTAAGVWGRDGAAARAEDVAQAAIPCHGGHDDPSPARGSAPCAEGEACCGGCAAPALVSATSSASDVAPATGGVELHGVGSSLARLPLPPVAAGMRHGPPPAAMLALRAVGTVVLRL